MADIRSGKIARGSWLLVESLDRITRLPVKQALKVIDEILDSGINIFELSENVPDNLLARCPVFAFADTQILRERNRVLSQWF
jgi:DNA invertase Pin-like site-specific DNA recombinase